MIIQTNCLKHMLLCLSKVYWGFILGWDEACLTMQLGEIAKILIRSDKGYGSQGFPQWGIHPNADLLFEIEILCIQ